MDKNKKNLKEIERLRASASNLRQIGVNLRSAKSLRKSIQINNRAKDLETSVVAVERSEGGGIRLEAQKIKPRVVLRLFNQTICTPDGRPVVKIGNLDVCNGDRILVMGRNGTGKTVLIREVDRLAAADGAERAIGNFVSPQVRCFLMDQTLTFLPSARTPHDYIRRFVKDDGQTVTSLLVNAGFPREQQLGTPIAKLSSGKRVRLALLTLRLIKPSFFLMDEPTNYLDVVGCESLEDEIISKELTGLFVSHDRSFGKNIATRFVVIEDKRLIEIGDPEYFYKALRDGERVLRTAPGAIIR